MSESIFRRIFIEQAVNGFWICANNHVVSKDPYRTPISCGECKTPLVRLVFVEREGTPSKVSDCCRQVPHTIADQILHVWQAHGAPRDPSKPDELREWVHRYFDYLPKNESVRRTAQRLRESSRIPADPTSQLPLTKDSTFSSKG